MTLYTLWGAEPKKGSKEEGSREREGGAQVDKFGCIKNQMSLKRTRTHPHSRIKKYRGALLKIRPFEGKSEVVGRPKSRDNGVKENFLRSFLAIFCVAENAFVPSMVFVRQEA